MFKEAQEAGPAAERIELYRKLLQTWPDAEVAPQAQFMIAMNLYHQAEYAKAAEIFSALPPTYDVLVTRGASLAATGDAVAATSAWRRAVELNPSGTEAVFNMA